MKVQVLALAFLATAAIGGIAWVFLYPLLSGERKAQNRRASVAKAEPVAVRQAQRDQRSRREHVEGTLKEAEARRAKDSLLRPAFSLSQPSRPRCWRMAEYSQRSAWLSPRALACPAGC
jgi:tight adherence protein B